MSAGIRTASTDLRARISARVEDRQRRYSALLDARSEYSPVEDLFREASVDVAELLQALESEEARNV